MGKREEKPCPVFKTAKAPGDGLCPGSFLFRGHGRPLLGASGGGMKDVMIYEKTVHHGSSRSNIPYTKCQTLPTDKQTKSIYMRTAYGKGRGALLTPCLWAVRKES
jgi:hypothetical protein